FAQLVEKARVLDRDDRLLGEVLDKLDLLVAEGTDFLAIDDDGADHAVVLQQWNSENGASPRHFCKDDGGTFLVGHVRNLDGLLCFGGAPEKMSRRRTNHRVTSTLRSERRWRIMERYGPNIVPLAKPQCPKPGRADARRIVKDSLENRLQL